ncbi:protein of unknown function [Methylacidimicrobium sp. AP8]|uniref:hypothetical protein n=1 Tax=Methylacidimicrobium sp. AP8 TaxID=2730359 RepID=UPI0018C04B64|nr:hypothetical protein [Methylacidimicrobium sp. AP8]CAB4243099.1 protein of unknown function [Methylacidimicrobium sp. AP8]
MFLRTLRLRRKDGSEAEYVRLVESYREKGKVKQRIVATLGRKDLLAPHLDRLAELLGRSAPASRRALEPQESTVWGPTLVARHLWKELGMEELLEEKRGKGKGLSLAERAFVLVVNRLLSRGANTPWPSGWRPTTFPTGEESGSGRSGSRMAEFGSTTASFGRGTGPLTSS